MTAVLLVSFGTLHAGARIRSLDRIAADVAQAVGRAAPGGGQAVVLQAYTSAFIRTRLAGQPGAPGGVEEAARQAAALGADALAVIPAFLTPGAEFRKMEARLEQCRALFKRARVAPCVLSDDDSIEEAAAALERIYRFAEDDAATHAVLVGHGADEAAGRGAADCNRLYLRLEAALRRRGHSAVHVLTLRAKPDVEDVLAALQGGCKKVRLLPLMLVAGGHVLTEMAGGAESVEGRFRAAGYEVECVLRGLGEYAEFRRLFAEKARRLV